ATVPNTTSSRWRSWAGCRPERWRLAVEKVRRRRAAGKPIPLKLLAELLEWSNHTLPLRQWARLLTRAYAAGDAWRRHGQAPLPEARTDTRPGTDARLGVYELRARLGAALFHPGDARLADVSPPAEAGVEYWK